MAGCTFGNYFCGAYLENQKYFHWQLPMLYLAIIIGKYLFINFQKSVHDLQNSLNRCATFYRLTSKIHKKSAIGETSN